MLCLASVPSIAQERDEAINVAKRAVQFLTEEVSTRGGYVWRYSSDLTLREGEGKITTETVWVQPPGTPAVGEAFLELHLATGDGQFLEAARKAGEILLKGQMRSGGWQAMIELEPTRRRRWAYRVDRLTSGAKDQSSLDDNKTQSALHFLIRLDQALQMRDPKIHEAVQYGLNALLHRAQLPGGGFPQVWMEQPVIRDRMILQKASFPTAWARLYPGHQKYWHRVTLNDNLAGDTSAVLFLAYAVYKDGRYFESALRLADSLVRLQMPQPQPAWAQQYDDQVQPTWARKFEPPAIATSESFDVIETLMTTYAHTGDPKYLDPVRDALTYLESCRLGDGRLARFYELETNRPLYMDRQYQLTFDDVDVPSHYAFKIKDRTESLRSQVDRISKMSREQLDRWLRRKRSVDDKLVDHIIGSIDARGAWVMPGELRYHSRNYSKQPSDIISMQVAVNNLKELARFIAATQTR
ncbi:MAG: pectate lyase [Planctomycetota bacterium]